MFCSSLRKRPEWASLPATLLSSSNPRWQEQSLETHDLAIPIPTLQQEKGLFHVLLLSSEDIQPSGDSMPRIERLYHQFGGCHVGIVFLLEQTSKGTVSLMNLQIRCTKYGSLPRLILIPNSVLSAFDMPIIPLSSISSLPAILFAFQRQLVATASATAPPSIPAIRSLLPFCSVNGPLPQHASNVLSDICNSIPELAHAATTKDGQDALRKWVTEPTPGVTDDIIEFWVQEYVVE
ncbi:hypothetical protein B7494_g5628 [Chlorociboria aeruginascens]|nr:hypothetical protein B7494_g5628 [Chlorociboria aeruginascens]